MTTVYVATNAFTYHGTLYRHRQTLNFNTSTATLFDDLEALLRSGALSLVDPGNPTSPPPNVTPDAKVNWYTGAGAPSSIGVVGDMYLDTTSLYVYGPKTGGGWGNPYAPGDKFGSSSYTYNNDTTIATETHNGVTTSYTYNLDGTVHTATRNGVTLTYTYNGSGKVVGIA